MESTSSHNFRISRSKYASLIDQSDIKWWSDIQTKRLKAGEHDSKKSSIAAENEIKEKKKNFVKSLPYTPIQCPITNCEISFLPNDMVMHFLSYHKDPAPLQRIFEKQRLIITMSPFEMNADETICVGLLSYARKNVESETGKNDLWLEQNLLLDNCFQQLSNDYPIFLLASVVPMDVFMRHRKEFVEMGCNNKCPSMLVLWLAGAANNNAKIFCTFTAFNEQHTYSRSAISSVRSLLESQCPYKFCNKDHNYFRLTFKELYSLVMNESTLKIELVFHENFDDTEY